MMNLKCHLWNRGIDVAKTSLIAKHKKQMKFQVREYNRCAVCGRPRAYLRGFDMCRICFIKLVAVGRLPGVVKLSW